MYKDKLVKVLRREDWMVNSGWFSDKNLGKITFKVTDQRAWKRADGSLELTIQKVLPDGGLSKHWRTALSKNVVLKDFENLRIADFL